MRDSSTRRIKTKITISRSFDTLLGIIFLFPFLDYSGPAYLIGERWDILILVDCIFLLFLNILFKRRFNVIYVAFGVFYSVLLLSTLINGQDSFPALYYAARMICFIFLVEYYAERKKLCLFLSLIKKVVGISILITLGFQLFNQDFWGFTNSHNWQNFLVSDNFLGYYYVAFLTIVYLDTYKNKKKQKLEMIVWAVLCFVSLIKAWAATCLAIYVIFVLLLYLMKNQVLKKQVFSYLTPIHTIWINIAISVSVIFFKIQNYFEWLIVGILHKSMTLSNRVFVWEVAVSNILKKPIFGYGLEKTGRLAINYSKILHRTYFSHNIFLEILIQGGVVAFLCFLLIYVFAGKKMDRGELSSDIKVILNLAIFSIVLMQFTEFVVHVPFPNLPLILCFYYKELYAELNNQAGVMC